MPLFAGAVSGVQVYEPSSIDSSVVIAGDFAYLSAVGAPGDAAESATSVLSTFNETLVALGSSLSSALRATVYLDNIKEDFNATSGVFASFWENDRDRPARSSIEMGNPVQGASVQIDLVAYVPGLSSSS